MPSNDKAAVSAMVLSNDASQLAVVVDKSKPRFLFRSPKNCELRIYDINSSYDSIALSDSLVFNQNYISSLAYSQNNTYLYFQKQDMQGNAVLHRYNLNSQSSEAITAVTAQGKLRYADSLLYIMHDSKIEVLAHTDTTLANIEKSTLNAAASFRYSGISSSSAIGMHGSLTYGYNGDTYYRCLAKQYELKDLPKAFGIGNVRVVISDVKKPNATYDQFTATLQSYANYYAFGMLQPNRHYTLAEEYKFGFNGKEMDNEIYGDGNALDFGARIYDSRLGRWMACDPLAAKYPWASPYGALGENPILNYEIDGRDYAVYVNHDDKTIIIKASYYVAKGNVDHLNSATEATAFWNEQSNKYQYKVGKGKDAIYYDIIFDLKPVEVDNPKREVSLERSSFPPDDFSPITTDGGSNTYDVLPNDDDIFYQQEHRAVGIAEDGVFIHVAEEYKSSVAGAHEVGHTLGFSHLAGSIMKEAINESKNTSVNSFIIGGILKNAGIGAVEYEGGGNGFIGVAKAHLQPAVGTAPEGFENGVVKKKK